MNLQTITSQPLFKDAAFVFAIILVLGAWKVVIERE